MPKAKEQTPFDRKEVYYFIDADKKPDMRVTAKHPSIGKYVVRASQLMTEELRAVVCCEWLNKMVEDREFNNSGYRGICTLFKVSNYKSSKKTFVVVRKLQVDDLTTCIDEFVEVKRR